MTNQRTIPYDYTFRFALSGEPGANRNAKIEVSVEASFTAVSIGYGVVPNSDDLTFGPQAPAAPPLALRNPDVDFTALSFRNLFDLAERAIAERPVLRSAINGGAETIFRDGVRIAPRFLDSAIHGLTLAPADAARAFQITSIPTPNVPFLYALFDAGTGRAFQNEPILSSAGLGSAGGERPFRPFAVPIVFEPRTLIRLEVTEASFFRGQLFVALHGYKTLGQPGTPTDPARIRPRRRPMGDRR